MKIRMSRLLYNFTLDTKQILHNSMFLIWHDTHVYKCIIQNLNCHIQLLLLLGSSGKQIKLINNYSVVLS